MRARPRAGSPAGPARPDEVQIPVDDQLREILAWLERTGSQEARDGMARYAIPSDKAFGIAVGALQKEARRRGRNHELAVALWKTGWYEARMLATFVDEPASVTAEQMDRWCGDFDSWAICDTACFHLFDRTPHAWGKIEEWAGRDEEFVKRTAFVLLACLALHDKKAGDEPFVRGLELIEREAEDERNFVKKGINWALRAIGGRNPALHAAATTVAARLAASPRTAPRWVGKDALRQLASPATARRSARGAAKSS
jgi:3-methyladenine DNA glycosylase AlkD